MATTAPVPKKQVKTSPFLEGAPLGGNLKEIFKLIIKYCQEVTADGGNFEKLYKKYRGGKEFKRFKLKNTPVLFDFAIYGLIIYIKMKIDFLKSKMNSKNKPNPNIPQTMILDVEKFGPVKRDDKLTEKSKSNQGKEYHKASYTVKISIDKLGLVHMIKSSIVNKKGKNIFYTMNRVIGIGDRLGMEGKRKRNEAISSEYQGLSNIMKDDIDAGEGGTQKAINLLLNFYEQADIKTKLDKTGIDTSINAAISEMSKSPFVINGQNRKMEDVLSVDNLQKNKLITIGIYGFYFDKIIKKEQEKEAKRQAKTMAKGQVRTSQGYVNNKVRINKKTKITYVQKINKSLNNRK